MLIHLLLQVSEDDIAKVNQEYNLDDVKIKDYINIINIWCNKQDHLVEAHKYMTPDVITRLIIISRGKVEETKTKIERLMTTRGMLPEVILNKSYEEFENLLENVIFIPMPKLDVSKSRIMIAKYCNPDLLGEFRLYVDYNISDIHILDLKGLTLNDVAQFNPIIFRKGEILHTKGYGLRVKGIHILNAPTYADKFISVLKPVLSEKVAGRIHVHNSYDDLHKYIPKTFLPEDYGGEEPSIAVIHEQWKEYLKTDEARKFLENSNKLKSDESKRNCAKFNEEYLGMPGSFRKLNVD
uniref:CTD28 n=1 Tax=Heliconius melpomene TaxID=34740 RepID=A0A2H4RMS7_HELME|nr:CTD28 [Heliconius melpomene]